MTIAKFIYENIYCRYLCPGECIFYERGALCNNIATLLAEKYNCNIRVISAEQPRANRQAAEAYVRKLKEKMREIMVNDSHQHVPNNWDESVLHLALQAIRRVPTIATGYDTN